MVVTHKPVDFQQELETRLGPIVAAWSPGAAVRNLAPLTGGASSLTYLLSIEGGEFADEKIVLKVAPPGLDPVRNRDVLRQGRLLRALGSHPEVPVPRILFEDAGAPPAVPPFIAMNFVEGECVEPAFSSDNRPSPDDVYARNIDAARVLARLHSVNPAEIGLGAEPVMSLTDEISRWTRAFRTVSPALSGDYLRCEAALLATMPEPLPPVITHGDYRLGNTLCAGNRVNSVIDWEIWSIGDPRIDTTWLTFFTDEAAHPAAKKGPPAGTPSNIEVFAAYEDELGRSLPDMVWFDALTKYKEASATALLLKRAMKSGKPLDPMAQGMHERMLPALPGLLSDAIALVS